MSPAVASATATTTNTTNATTANTTATTRSNRLQPNGTTSRTAATATATATPPPAPSSSSFAMTTQSKTTATPTASSAMDPLRSTSHSFSRDDMIDKQIQRFAKIISLVSLFFWIWALYNTHTMTTGPFDLGIFCFALSGLSSVFCIRKKWIVVLSYISVALTYALGFLFACTAGPHVYRAFAFYCALFFILWIGAARWMYQLQSMSLYHHYHPSTTTTTTTTLHLSVTDEIDALFHVGGAGGAGAKKKKRRRVAHFFRRGVTGGGPFTDDDADWDAGSEHEYE